MVRARRMCVFTLASLMPRRFAISLVESPPATARRTSRCRSVNASIDRTPRRSTRRARRYPATTPTSVEAARCTQDASDRDLRAFRSARALQRAALAGADDLMLETLEEQLPTATRAKG